MSGEIDEYLSLRFQGIKKKNKCHERANGHRMDRRMDGHCENNILHHKVCGGRDVGTIK